MSQPYRNNKNLLKLLGANIRSLRQQQDLSQEELAFRISSARNFIGCIERGEKAPTIITLHRIARALNLKIENLVRNID